MKPESKYEIKKRLQCELEEIKIERANIETERMNTSVLDERFDQLCERDKELSVKQFTAKFKLARINDNKPMLGYALPSHSTTDTQMQGRAGQKAAK